ncbi:MAG TPA: BMP family ABC transporter substrate-binding protein [Stackebrandtia sp.]|jgi:basic membrane protein A|uniref:BMP family lipoprotein n=1 Tax=Stackebrandtia sp. TaxID=2023065 RepID=UPI002D22224B|nr:BMP family ABC transporter substrate-binding protein [Stackebrandtia sp.]HZE39386.1 BMP family ABC transporter substrate-binding protein [Stackebrandtia sp.]
MRATRVAAIGIIGTVALVAAACGEAPKGADAVKKDFKGCMVTDVGGIDDKSFNTSAWAGMKDAEKKQPHIEVDYKSSASSKDYEPNLKAYLKNDCDVIVAVGGLMFNALQKVAKDNPDQQFAIVDANMSMAKNVESMEFNTAEPSFLAGYTAAASSKSGKVATFGGQKIDPVTIYMDGFAQGVDYYNKAKHKNVKLLGWDAKSQKGAFTGDFQDATGGKKQAETFVSQGADVIFPVAGQAGVGGLSVTQDKANKGKVKAIWVDVDGCKSAKKYCDDFLTTSEKHIADAVSNVLINARDNKGKVTNTRTVGTLDNKGVGLAAFGDGVDSKVQDEVNKLKQDIIDGKIKITSKAQPEPVK